MNMYTAEALKRRGFKILLCDKSLIKIGKKDYVVKSVYTGRNNKTICETLTDLAQKKAFDKMQS